jgi:hypothetical protein
MVKNKLGNVVRKLRLYDRCIVLVKEGTDMAKIENINAITAAIEQTTLKEVLILVVGDLEDVKVLNETELNRAGWFRADALRRIIKR